MMQQPREVEITTSFDRVRFKPELFINMNVSTVTCLKWICQCEKNFYIILRDRVWCDKWVRHVPTMSNWKKSPSIYIDIRCIVISSIYLGFLDVALPPPSVRDFIPSAHWFSKANIPNSWAFWQGQDLVPQFTHTHETSPPCTVAYPFAIAACALWPLLFYLWHWRINSSCLGTYKLRRFITNLSITSDQCLVIGCFHILKLLSWRKTFFFCNIFRIQVVSRTLVSTYAFFVFCVNLRNFLVNSFTFSSNTSILFIITHTLKNVLIRTVRFLT